MTGSGENLPEAERVRGEGLHGSSRGGAWLWSPVSIWCGFHLPRLELNVLKALTVGHLSYRLCFACGKQTHRRQFWTRERFFLTSCSL